MSKSAAPTKCARCGRPASGRFCANCGTALDASICSECGKPLSGDARFCHHCGASVGGAPRGAQAERGRMLAWLVPGIAAVTLVAFLIGQRVARGPVGDESQSGTSLSTRGGAPFASGGGRAVDLSQMTPDEQASRLFDRVMRYAEEGKQDSARTFAPMAIQAYEMLGAPDAHSRFDIGMIAAVSGDSLRADAEADTILAKDRSHLLGLVLAIKVAGLRGDQRARAAFQKRLVAAEPAERAKTLKGYEEHQRNIDAALKEARGARP